MLFLKALNLPEWRNSSDPRKAKSQTITIPSLPKERRTKSKRNLKWEAKAKATSHTLNLVKKLSRKKTLGVTQLRIEEPIPTWTCSKVYKKNQALQPNNHIFWHSRKIHAHTLLLRVDSLKQYNPNTRNSYFPKWDPSLISYTWNHNIPPYFVTLMPMQANYALTL